MEKEQSILNQVDDKDLSNFLKYLISVKEYSNNTKENDSNNCVNNIITLRNNMGIIW